MNGAKIKALRQRAGLTQAALADLLGLSQQAVASWESGERSPRASDIPRLADALKCPIGELFGEEEEHDPHADDR